MRTREENRKYMYEYRRRPGNMAKHNEQTREWKIIRRLIDKTWGATSKKSLYPEPERRGRPRKVTPNTGNSSTAQPSGKVAF